MKLYYVDRKTQIKHFTDLRILAGLAPVTELELEVPASEDFVVQIAAVPEAERLVEKVSFSGGLDLACINTQVTDKFGKSYEKEVPLQQNQMQPFFFILPACAQRAGKTANGTVTLHTDKGDTALTLKIHYTAETVENRGYNDLWRLSRLSWLNSTRFSDSNPVPPYTLPELDGRTVKLLGRKLTFGENGLPRQVLSYFDEGVRLTDSPQKELFQKPMEFVIAGETVRYSEPQFRQDGGRVQITAAGRSEHFALSVTGTLYYEGFLDYAVQVTALNRIQVDDISLNTSLAPDCARYINGLGAVGGAAKDITFRWNGEKHLDCLYVGAVNAGMRLKWKAEHYSKPLINIYYKNMPLVVPESTWDNRQKGSVTFQTGRDGAAVRAATGQFSMAEGESRSFKFELHLTPLKPIDYKKHYAVRYSHSNKLKNELKEADKAEKLGLNYMVIHHGNMVHPFINYPFIETQRMKQLVDYAGQKNIGVKCYYTTREHSNHMAEVFAYKALGDEIILRKKGQGYAWHGGTAKWLTEYFGDEIIPAWKVEYKHGKYKGDPDVSFIVRPNSRLDNYYIEGLDWLVKNIGIKGIYIDDTALDRTTLERAKKVLLQNGGLIDMHMWNHEEERAGDVSCMNLYTELFPFLDSLWIGEGYYYKNLSPDYLLTEVSGIPYGQTSQMLQDGGEPYIGMLYAMNNRYGWGAKNAPRIYALWDNFGIENSEMRGYWHSQNPVDTGNEHVKATVYLKEDSALVCMFNFSKQKTVVFPQIQQDLLGFSAGSAKQVPIRGLQREKALDCHKGIQLKGKSGLIFLLEK